MEIKPTAALPPRKSAFGLDLATRADRALMAASLIGAILPLTVLLSPSLHAKFFGTDADNNQAAVVGQVAVSKNDLRRKVGGRFEWQPAKRDELLRKGDSIFTGDNSTSQISLRQGGHIDIGEQTLMKFTEVDGITIPSLSSGNFKLVVDGTMKIAIDGEVTELQGTGSEVEIVIDEKAAPVIKLIKGETKIARKDGPAQELKPNAPTLVTSLPDVAPATTVVTATTPTIEPSQISEKYTYAYRLNDVFEQSPTGAMKYRIAYQQGEVEKKVSLFWKTRGDVEKVYFQHSRTPEFDGRKSEPSTGVSKDLARVWIGRNYWRISRDNKEWSEPQYFLVEPAFHRDAGLRLSASQESAMVLDQPGELLARIDSTEAYQGYLLETSTAPSFPPESTRIEGLSSTTPRIPFSEAGTFYYRVRGINSLQEITEPSAALRLQVSRPKRPQAPLMAVREIEVFVGETANLTWSANAPAVSFQVALFSANGVDLGARATQQPRLVWSTDKVGRYLVQVRALDQYGRTSAPSETASILVKERPVVAPTLAKVETPPEKTPVEPASTATEVDREPANTGSIAAKIATLPSTFLNQTFRSSKIAVEGATSAIQSTDQMINGQPLLIAASLALRVQKWWRDYGVEVSGKGGTSIAGASGAKVMQGEARLHRRWRVPFDLFAGSQGSQISVFAGAESFGSSGTKNYSPGYNLMKGGVAVQFPFMKRWDTGGEVVGGLAQDMSRKMEVSGNLHYYTKQEFSIGVGYRVHLFEAGSKATTPTILPYREGYGEGYSVLRWHY